MKILSGRELAGFVKERQFLTVQAMKTKPRLAILRDNDNPVISKYVSLKKKYAEDVGILVDDLIFSEGISDKISQLNHDAKVDAIIVQLPLENNQDVDDILNNIVPEKDVDGLGGKSKFDSATATAINWLMAGYSIDLTRRKIAIVGEGRLVGGPLKKMWLNSGYNVQGFVEGDSLESLSNFDVIVSATGVPRLIKNEMVKPGAVVVDAGTTSENGVLVGDVDDAVRLRDDLFAITPKVGGVGPLTIACLFEHVIRASEK